MHVGSIWAGKAGTFVKIDRSLWARGVLEVPEESV